MIDRRTLSTMLIAGVATSFFGGSKRAPAQPVVNTRNVVLVHGAYADGSCWSEVIGRLQLAGLTVTAVQNPLTSLADDVAATAGPASLGTATTWTPMPTTSRSWSRRSI